MLKFEPFQTCGFAVKGNVAMQAYLYVAVLAFHYCLTCSVVHAAPDRYFVKMS